MSVSPTYSSLGWVQTILSKVVHSLSSRHVCLTHLQLTEVCSDHSQYSCSVCPHVTSCLTHLQLTWVCSDHTEYLECTAAGRSEEENRPLWTMLLTHLAVSFVYTFYQFSRVIGHRNTLCIWNEHDGSRDGEQSPDSCFIVPFRLAIWWTWEYLINTAVLLVSV